MSKYISFEKKGKKIKEKGAKISIVYKAILLIIMYTSFYLHVYMPIGQKRAPDPITDGCEPPCVCWELNSGPLWPEDLFIIISKYTVVVFRHSRRECQIPLQMVVSHQVVAGN